MVPQRHFLTTKDLLSILSFQRMNNECCIADSLGAQGSESVTWKRFVSVTFI